MQIHSHIHQLYHIVTARLRVLCAFATFLLLWSADAQAQYWLENAFPNLALNDPVDLQSPRDGTDRLFAVQLAGGIVVFPNDSSASQPELFLDIHTKVSRESDGGLLGMAFHPDYADNGYFYVNYTAADSIRKVISRFSVDASNPNRADPESELVLLEIPLELSGHNGGQILFGPDEYLYVATGDGNPHTADSSGNGQNPATLTGTMIRIDVDNSSDSLNYGIPSDNPFVGMGPDYREEVYAYGFRNPWRFSFDSETGDLWLGDVGAGSWEEIDIVEKGRNYGWNILEGRHCFEPPAGCNPDTLSSPIWDYSHSPDSIFSGRSVTGGYVYRGPGTPELFGKYVFGDFVNGKIWALAAESDTVRVEELVDTGYHIVAFGVDSEEELYAVTIEDSLYRIRYSPPNPVEGTPLPTLAMRVYPNPSSGDMSIAYELPRAGRVILDVYNVLGARVRRLENRTMASGGHALTWDGLSSSGVELPAGTYYLRLQIDDHVAATRAVIRVR